MTRPRFRTVSSCWARRLDHPAALIYLHKTAGRDRRIAEALGELVKDTRGTDPVCVDDQGASDPGPTGGTEGHADPKGYAGGTRRK